MNQKEIDDLQIGDIIVLNTPIFVDYHLTLFKIKRSHYMNRYYFKDINGSTMFRNNMDLLLSNYLMATKEQVNIYKKLMVFK